MSQLDIARHLQFHLSKVHNVELQHVDVGPLNQMTPGQTSFLVHARYDEEKLATIYRVTVEAIN